MDRAIAIDVSRLCKTYDGHKAVDDLSFQVYAGEIFGLLGPNGAGKSTTLRTLITLLHPTSGTATVFGHDTVRGHGAHDDRLCAAGAGHRPVSHGP
jgi:ABC-2 type transport system ATP-binding protein